MSVEIAGTNVRTTSDQSAAALKRRMLRGALRPDYIAVLRSVDPWWDDPRGRLYATGLTALDVFIAREGHARVSHSHVEDGFLLGAWVSNRRTDHRRGVLSAARRAELDGREGWTWDPAEDEFTAALAVLDAFIAREGHAVVPGRHAENGFGLGTWASKRRLDYRRGRLSADRAAVLEARAGWTWSPLVDDYRVAVNRLDVFADREGHTRVPSRHMEDGFALGSWVVKRRGDRKRGAVTAEQAAELDGKPGWTWDPNADEFRMALTLLDDFIAREGHARVHRAHCEQGFRLGKWVSMRRARKNADPVQTAELNARPGWTWDPLADDFSDGLDSFDRFSARTGHGRVPQRHVEGDYPLGRWVTARRVERRDDRLAHNRVVALDGRPGWTWEPSDDDFDRGLTALGQYIRVNGCARVPRAHVVGGFKLGKWVSNRRDENGVGRLSGARATALEAMPGWSW